jgi:hypothetical protein
MEVLASAARLLTRPCGGVRGLERRVKRGAANGPQAVETWAAAPAPFVIRVDSIPPPAIRKLLPSNLNRKTPTAQTPMIKTRQTTLPPIVYLYAATLAMAAALIGWRIAG